MPASPARSAPLLLAALVAATALAYLPGVDGDFLFDDQAILESPLVLAPLERPLGEWLADPRPLTTLTFALDRLAAGTDPRGWHLTSIAIHLLVVLLAWRLLRRLLERAGLARPEGAALAAAALFALHPLQSEAVAYLSQRAEALAAGCYLAALLLLLGRDDLAAEGPQSGPATGAGRRRAWLLGGAALAQWLGSLAKPTVATLPAAWLLLAALVPAPGEVALGPAGRVRRRLLPALPLLALSLLSALGQLAPTAGSIDAGFDIPGLGPAAYLATQLRVVPAYLRLALWPAGLHADWDVEASGGLGDPWALAGGALLALLAAGAWRLASRAGRPPGDGAGSGSGHPPGDGQAAARVAGFGVLFFLLTLAPSSSLVPLRDLAAEHRAYLGLLGLAAAAAACGVALVRRLAPGRPGLAGGALLALVLLPLAAATAGRAAIWTTHLALWSDAAAKSPGKARPHLNLGTAHFQEGRFEAALASYRRARALCQDGSVEPQMVLANVVAALIRLGRLDEARTELEGALGAASPGEAGPAHALGLLAELEFVAGRPAESERAASRALALDPTTPEALKYLGAIRSLQGELPAARGLLAAATEALPRDLGVWLELGRVEERLGDRPAACAAYRRAAGQPGPQAVAAEAARALQALGCR